MKKLMLGMMMVFGINTMAQAGERMLCPSKMLPVFSCAERAETAKTPLVLKVAKEVLVCYSSLTKITEIRMLDEQGFVNVLPAMVKKTAGRTAYLMRDMDSGDMIASLEIKTGEVPTSKNATFTFLIAGNSKKMDCSKVK